MPSVKTKNPYNRLATFMITKIPILLSPKVLIEVVYLKVKSSTSTQFGFSGLYWGSEVTASMNTVPTASLSTSLHPCALVVQRHS